MSIKLKIFGLGVLVMLATSAVAIMNATAATGGHFVSDTTHSIISGTETATHKLEFRKGTNPNEWIACTKTSYVGTTSAATVTEIKVTPSWSECYTTGAPGTKFEIHEGDCYLVLTVSSNPEGHNTVHLHCISSPGITITHPNCTVRIPPQTVLGPVSYKRIVEDGKHVITAEFTGGGTTTFYEAGICIFLGTHQTGEVGGSITLRADSTGGERTGITAT